MKLLFCPECQDVVKLRLEETRTCYCGKSHGVYLDELNAQYGGRAVPLGFANSSLAYALRAREELVINDEDNRTLGETFTAFTIPSGAPSIELLDGPQLVFNTR